MVRLVKDPGQHAAIHAVLRSHACLLRETFRHYAAANLADPFSMGFNTWTDFRCAFCNWGGCLQTHFLFHPSKDMGIDEPGKGADLDNVFVATNFTKDKNPLNPENAIVRCACGAGSCSRPASAGGAADTSFWRASYVSRW